MILIDTPTGQALRPTHLLLMLYRYLSGAYQLGDVAALNYVKGFLDGRAPGAALERVLTVSGHGIGEPEIWLSDRLPGAVIDTVSFRLIDTQLLQFLRGAGRHGVTAAFEQFRQMVGYLPALARLLDDDGLVPYWELQAEEWSPPCRSYVNVYSDLPVRIPDSRRYDLIYVRHGVRYLDISALARLRQHLRANAWLAALVPAHGESGLERAAHSRWVMTAKERFNELLARRGYPPVRDGVAQVDFTSIASAVEQIRFSVPAPAKSILVGELLLYSMHEHLSDRVRLEVLAETLDSVSVADVSVREILHLYLIGGDRL